MPSRCVLVMGIPRAGTSCVAGVLHKLGCDMGTGSFQPTDKFNPRGYFEDLRWRHANQRITGRGYSLQAARTESIGKKQRQIYRNLARESAHRTLWGIKDPWLCFVGQFIWPILEAQSVDVRMVAITRDAKASVASVARHLRSSYKGRYKYGAETIIMTWADEMRKRLVEFNGPIYHVRYEALVGDSMRQIQRLIPFVFDGSSISPNGNVKAVARWVTPKLKHF